MTLNLGLRYDPRSIPTLDKAAALVDLAQSTGSPRLPRPSHGIRRCATGSLGSASRSIPFGDRKTSIRAGYGMFHSPITANRFGPAYALNPPFALGVQVRLPFPPVPVFPTPNPSASQISQMQALDYDMDDSPRLQQWNVNVQREVLRNTSVTVAYVGSRGDHLQRQRDTNPVPPRTLADGAVVYGSRAGAQTISNARVNPVFAALISANSYSESDYHSLQAASTGVLRATCSRSCRTRCRAAATRRRAIRRSKAAPRPPIRTTSDYDYGPCLVDRTHNLRASAIYQLPFTSNPFVAGWQVSAHCQRGERRAVHAADRFRSGRVCRRAARSVRTWRRASRSTTR